MAAATGQNFDVPRGDSASVQFTVTNRDGTTADLTGATVTWAYGPYRIVQNVIVPGHALETKTAGDGLVITLPNLVAVTIPDEETVGWDQRSYFHQLKVEVGGNVTTVASGLITVTPELLP